MSVLSGHERAAGHPLSEREALAVCAAATVIMVPPDVAEATTRERGYDDIDPRHCWAQWQEARAALADP